MSEQQRASGRHACTPINAADAAKRAAHAPRTQQTSYRQAAAGTNRERAEELGRRQHGSSHRVALIGSLIGVALAVLVIFVVGSAVMNVLLYDDTAADAPVAAQDGNANADTTATTPVDQAVDASGTIDFLGSTYGIEPNDDGTYAFASRTDGSSDAFLPAFTIAGDPVGFALCEGTFYVVSNANGSYAVQSFVPGDGSLAATYREGTGTIAHIALEGTTLQLTDEAGAVTAVDLPTH